MFYAVVLAGGSGTRFWPKSRLHQPKQLLDILGESPLIKQTVDRLERLFTKEKILVVTQAQYVESIRRYIELPAENILAEPEARNTAAAIGLAAVELKHRSGADAVFAVLPSDHYVADLDAFLKTILVAKEVALKGYLVTVGIRPRYPETGYGYIELGEPINEASYPGVYRVKSFVEKPNMARAAQFLSEGNYLWNSGTFIWRVETFLEALHAYLPSLYTGLEQIEQADLNPAVLVRIYKELPKISVDYAIMEKANNRAVVVGDYSWNDIGSWATLGELLEKDEQGNVQWGEVISLDCSQSILYSEQGLIAAIGLHGMIVVSSGDAILICPKEKAQQVRNLVAELKRRGLQRYL
jgi:mannose-1-phosphate guanylyltransferase